MIYIKPDELIKNLKNSKAERRRAFWFAVFLALVVGIAKTQYGTILSMISISAGVLWTLSMPFFFLDMKKEKPKKFNKKRVLLKIIWFMSIFIFLGSAISNLDTSNYFWAVISVVSLLTLAFLPYLFVDVPSDYREDE